MGISDPVNTNAQNLVLGDATSAPAVLLLITHALKRARLSDITIRLGCRAVAVQTADEARLSATQDRGIGVLVAETLFGANPTDVVTAMRKAAARPLAAVLLVPDAMFASVSAIAQAGPIGVLREMPTEEEFTAALRVAVGWYCSAANIGEVTGTILRMLAQIETQLGDLMTSSGLQPADVRAGRSARDATPAHPPVTATTIKSLMRIRGLQERILGPGLIEDAAWVMLLDLLLSHLDGKPIAVTALCVGSGVPVTTALRRLDQLIAKGMALKIPDREDRRRFLVSITPKGIENVSLVIARIQSELGLVAA